MVMVDNKNWLVNTTEGDFILSNLWGFFLENDNEELNYVLISLRDGNCVGFYEKLDDVKETHDVLHMEEYKGTR